MFKYFLFIALSIFSMNIHDRPLKYISGSEYDLDNNGVLDMVFMLDTSKGCELIAIIRLNDEYKSYLLYENFNNRNISEY